MFPDPKAGTIQKTRRFYPEPENGEGKMTMIFKSFAATAALTAALALGACGTTPGDRAVSGGLLGAGAGAAIGSLSGNAGTGAIIGGIGGAAVGAVTDPCTLNLGDPFWRDNGGAAEYRRRCGR
jgi:hypothetical protein